MLKLKLQYFDHLIWRADAMEMTLMLGRTEGKRRRRWQDEMIGWHHQFNGHEYERILGDGEGQGSLACCSSRGHKVRHNWQTEQNCFLNSEYFTDCHINKAINSVMASKQKKVPLWLKVYLNYLNYVIHHFIFFKLFLDFFWCVIFYFKM